jgi:hypothetical protein
MEDAGGGVRARFDTSGKKGSACGRWSGGVKMGKEKKADRGNVRGRTRGRPANDVPSFSRKFILFRSRDFIYI